MSTADASLPTSRRPSTPRARVAGDDTRFDATELVRALEPYGKLKWAPGGVRLIDILEPHRVDEATRRVVAEHLEPLMVDFFGAEHGTRLQRFGDKFAILDRLVIVVGKDTLDIRSWAACSLVDVGRRPVLWVHGVVVRPGLQSTRLTPLTIGPILVDEWIRQHFRPIYIVGTTRNAQLTHVLRAICGKDSVFPRRDAFLPEHIRRVAEVVGGRTVEQLKRGGVSVDPALELESLIIRNAFGSDDASPVQGRLLRPQDANLVVVDVPMRKVLAQIPKLGNWIGARRRAESRLRRRRAARR